MYIKAPALNFYCEFDICFTSRIHFPDSSTSLMTQAFGHRESSALSGYRFSSEAVYAKQPPDEQLAACTLCAPATSSSLARPTVCTSLPMPAWQLVSESAFVHPPSAPTSCAAAGVDHAFASQTDAPAPAGVQPAYFNVEKATSNLLRGIICYG